MATQKPTEYKKMRLENIRKNDEMMAALQLHSKASLLSNATKRQRDGAGKTYKVSPKKKWVSCLSKIFNSCYARYLRLLDVEKEVFDLVHSCHNAIFSLSQHPNDVKSLYYGEGCGRLSVWDDKTGRVSSQWSLDEDRIKTIDFNSQNPIIMATSSSVATVCLWDLRRVDAVKPQSLKIVKHMRAS